MAPFFRAILRKLAQLPAFILLITTGLLVGSPAHAATCRALEDSVSNPDPIEILIANGSPTALKLMLANVEPLINPGNPSQGVFTGAVVAGGISPLPNMQNYQFHWDRDAGITTTMLVDLYMDSESQDEKNLILQKLVNSLVSAKRLQDIGNLSGAANVTYDPVGGVLNYYLNMGEPKRNLDLSNFMEAWGRDQTDGPPFRLKGILQISRLLWNDWDTIFGPTSPVHTTLTKADLYKPVGNNGSIEEVESLIKRHLQYSYHNWNRPTVEMWEMMRGNHFANIGVHQAVLITEGPDFANFVGDTGAGTAYQNMGNLIEQTLLRFWDGKIIHATMDLGSGKFLDVKPEGPTDGLDTATLIGAMHMKSRIFTPASDYLLSTVYEMEQGFKTEYALNQRPGVNAILWGRYTKDSYDGHTTGGTGKGNPWFLTSYYVAEHAYKAAQEITVRGQVSINDLNVNFYNSVLEGAGRPERVSVGQSINSGDALFGTLTESLMTRGDNIIKRLESFRGPNGEMSEQIDRDATSDSPAFQRSIPTLTWSYAAYFRAVKARKLAKAALPVAPTPKLSSVPKKST